jgi:hypothetical protein
VHFTVHFAEDVHVFGDLEVVVAGRAAEVADTEQCENWEQEEQPSSGGFDFVEHVIEH